MPEFRIGAEFYHNKPRTTAVIERNKITVTPETLCKKKGCYLYKERGDNERVVNSFFGHNSVWDFQTCLKACIYREF